MKRTNRIICWVLAAVVAVSAIVISATNEKNTLNFGVLNTPTGSGYEVKVIVSSDYLCAGVQGVVEYDTNKLIYMGATDNGAVDTSRYGKLKISKLANDVKGKLVELTFLSDELIFEDSFAFSKVKGVAVVENNVSASEEAYNFTYADCNDNNKIDIIDLVRMKKMTVDADEDDFSADLDNDGAINGPDLVIMRKILLGTYKSSLDNRVINVSDFGAVGDGVTDDSAAINKAVKALSLSEDNSVLNFDAEKTYFVSGSAGTAINLSGVENKTINGNASTILADKDKTYLVMTDSKNVTVKGLNFDLKQRAHFVGDVVAKGTDENGAEYFDIVSDRDFGLDGEYIPNGQEFGFVVTDDVTSRGYMVFTKIETLDKATLKYRIYPNMEEQGLKTYSQYNDLNTNKQVILPVPGIGHNGSHMLTVYRNTNITFKDINVYNAPYMVWILRNNLEKITFENVNVMRAPDEEVCFSSWRDAFHAKSNSAQFIWKNCTIEGNGDDMFNLSANLLYVNEVISENEVVCGWVENPSSAYENPEIGSDIVIWDTDTGEIIGKTTLKAVSSEGRNRFVLTDNLPKLTAGTNILFAFDSHACPDTQIINCDLDGTLRFRSGPVTVENCDIRLIKAWIEAEDPYEGGIPHDITFNSCDFTVGGGGSGVAFIIRPDNNAKTDVKWQEGLYKVENIVFNNCTGLKKSHFSSSNLSAGYIDSVTFNNTTLSNY